MKIKSAEDMIRAAEQISKEYDCAVLCKGGHQMHMPMTCFLEMAHITGLTENVLTIRIPMEPDAPFQCHCI